MPTVVSEVKGAKVKTVKDDQAKADKKAEGSRNSEVKTTTGNASPDDKDSKDQADFIKERMRRLIRASGKTLVEIGRLMGVPDDSKARQAIGNLLRSKNPTFSNMLAFCVALQVDLGDLVTQDNERFHLAVAEVARR